MSTKKDKFTSKDRYFMNLAINLAKNRVGLTGLNPSVGCVVVKNSSVVSLGTTELNGRPHAETVALKYKKKEIKGSTVYITLEPCSHYGKTPPCTNALIKSNVKKVIYSIEDVDTRSSNKSKKILKNKRISTKSGLLEKEAKNLYKNYIFVKKNNLPYITGKLACSSDTFIARGKFKITNEYSQSVSHQLRYKNHAILTSYKTINSDNPKLSCRIRGLEKFSPTKIVIDKDLKIKKNSHLVNNAPFNKTIIFYNKKKISKIKFLKNKGIKLIYFNVEKNSYFDLKKILKKIYNLGIHYVLVECGQALINEMIVKNLINEFYLFKSNKNLNYKDKINVINIKKNLNKKFKNKNYVNTYLDKDKLIHYY